MPLNRLLVPCYRVIATTATSRTEFSLSDFWPEVFAWIADQTAGENKNCCERFSLQYLQQHHFASISTSSFACCLQQIDAWLNEHGSPYEGFAYELDTLHGMANGNARGFVVVQEKDYHHIAYIIPGIEQLDVTVIPHRFTDE